ncbi:hypothetical protein [Neobacillus mesonae]|uniref:hypothetical protein n=1 Tax=Neobacillus mesonae TaxID=1193713 RepID=UPI00203E2906|nr:hypothetical protein [Neobacillus mesonae]MCM3567838.1 hypothetical protein [Neobacillus mesonae]
MVYTKTDWKDHVVDATTGAIIQQGTPVSAKNLNNMEQGIAEAHANMEQAGRQTQTLIHGLNVLNGGVNAPVNIQIEGRTLNSMLNSDLDPLKYYVLADKKTKLTYNSVEYQGITKFTAVAGKPTTIKRLANFEGKVSGSTMENPHKAYPISNQALLTPSNLQASYEGAQPTYDQIAKLDGTTRSVSTTTNGYYAETIFAFDIIQEIERQIGRIPKSTLEDKIQWVKDNIVKITCNWWGYGSGPNGNKATLQRWSASTSTWSTDAGNNVNAKGTVTNIKQETATPTNNIDSMGFVHFLAYADASDGVTTSTIYTDYVELEIELKSGAILHAPRIPLYEVKKEHYEAINVTWSEAEILARYPQVEGVQHLQNPYVIAEGENLVPPFSAWDSLHPTVVDVKEYELIFDGLYGTSRVSYVFIKTLPNQKYAVSFDDENTGVRLYTSYYDVNNTLIKSDILTSNTNTFIIPANAVATRVNFDNNAKDGRFIIKNIMITIGDKAKPFVPRNPSYALFETKLGSIGGVSDRLYEQDGKYMVRKAIEKDIVLDGSWGWLYFNNYTGYKGVRLPNTVFAGIAENVTTQKITKYDGKIIPYGFSLPNGDNFNITNPTGYFYISIFNFDSGFGETYTPVADEIKAYFNGWKVKTVDVNGKPSAWTSLYDGSDAPTQTLAYVSANKAPNFTPYKLSYQLATPVISEVSAEGAISVNGITQVEVGSGVVLREKVTPAFINEAGGGYYQINRVGLPNESQTKYAVSKFLFIVKGNTMDKNWSFSTNNVVKGAYKAIVRDYLFDQTVDYYATYVVYDKNIFTSNVTNLLAQYSNNIRTALEDTVKKVEDVKTETSVNTLLLYDVLKRLKAGGL